MQQQAATHIAAIFCHKTMMNYEETCDYLYSQTPSFEKTGKTGFNEGLAITLALDEHFDHPHRSFRSVHVAGTNGKGSVSHTLAAQLQAAGYRVGLYTSPHLVDFRERIRVNGIPVTKEYVVDFVDKAKPFYESLKPSFFEITTAMAFCYFRHMKVDIAVIEVGLGGRLDCTNIITPVLSVITNISLDHTDMLGDTLAAIAGEKAGIIKPGVPVIIGESHPETRPVFQHVAEKQGAPILFADDHPLVVSATPLKNGGIHYVTAGGEEFDGELSGLYQMKNTNTALHAIDQLICQGILNKVDYTAFAKICQTTGLMGRWQMIREQPLVICDTGHNTGGWRYLSEQIRSVSCQTLRIVFGMVSDKDVSTVMSMLPRNAKYYFTKADTHRAIPETRIRDIGQAFGLEGKCFSTVAEAYRAALEDSCSNDFIFVGGSTYVVADFMKTAI